MTIVNALKDYIVGLRHVGYVVDDLDEALDNFRRVYGLQSADIQRIPETIDASTPTVFAFFRVADTEFELIQALSGDSRRQLTAVRSGNGGINHVAWQVSDLDTCIQLLATRGIGPGHVTPDGPLEYSRGRLLYLNPEHCGGLLIELMEAAH